MTSTALLQLPYIASNQNQKHITHNEALRMLDALVQLSVLDRDLSAPPDAPADGARYIVADGASGAWTGWDGSVAAYQDGAWIEFVPLAGWLSWLEDESKLLCYDGAGWSDFISTSLGAALAGGSFDKIGVNASADATNRLALSSSASLFNHAGNGHQIKVNKAAAGDTNSLLFQTNFSGRAEMGCAGNDDFSVKVSPDGSSWYTGFEVDKDTGEVSFPQTPLLRTDQLNVDGFIKIDRIANGATIGGKDIGTVPYTFGDRDWVFTYGQNGYSTLFRGLNGDTLFGAARDNGTAASPTAVSDGDAIWKVWASGRSPDGVHPVKGVFEMFVDGTPSGSSVNYKLHLFGTTIQVTNSKTQINNVLQLDAYTVATVPSASIAPGGLIYISDESGGAVLAFSDGTNWRRSTDRAIIS